MLQKCGEFLFVVAFPAVLQFAGVLRAEQVAALIEHQEVWISGDLRVFGENGFVRTNIGRYAFFIAILFAHIN